MPHYIRVDSAAGSYSVICGPGMLGRAGKIVGKLGEQSGMFVLSSPRVWRHWGRTIARNLGASGRDRVILFDDREAAKRMSTVEGIARALVRAGADRHALLVAAGGGVVGDVAGFAAASYLRGVRVVQIPTTLVAQVDSAIGGKTGVNLPEGKNLVGAFYPPRLVIADPATLGTLAHREFRSGLYEVIKYGVIADRPLFEFLEKRMAAVLRREPKALGWMIPRCIAIKARVVTADEREGGLRQILNFGHTLGHAFEAATHYRRFLHGEAVGWGMIAATLIAVAAGGLGEREAARVIRLVASVGPLPPLGKMKPEELRRIVRGDKKSRDGEARWVLPRRIGSVRWGEEIPWAIVARTLAELPAVAAEAGA